MAVQPGGLTPAGAPRFGTLVAVIVGFLSAGVPLVALTWHNVNHLLSGDLRPGPLAILIVAGSALAGLLVGLARVVDRLTDQREPGRTGVQPRR